MKNRALLFSILGILGLMVPGFSQTDHAKDSPAASLDEIRPEFEARKEALKRPLVELQGLYYQQLAKLRDGAQADGDLEKVVALNAEIRILAGKAPQETAADFDELVRLRDIYSGAKAKRMVEVKGRLIPLLRSFADRLETEKIELTKAGQIDAAKVLHDEIGLLAEEISQLQKSVEKLVHSATGTTEITYPPDLEKNLVFRFDFNEQPENSLVHSTFGEGFSAQVERAVWTDSGKQGGAFRFSGEGNRLRVSKPLPDSREMTVSAWVFYESPIADHGAIFSDFDGRSGNDVMFGLVGGSTIYVRADKGSGNDLRDALELGEDVSNQWHHLVWTLGSSRSTVYLDGKRVGSVSKGGSNIGSHDAFIGYGNNGKGWTHFLGLIDEVAVWETDLSASDVEKLYLATR